MPFRAFFHQNDNGKAKVAAADKAPAPKPTPKPTPKQALPLTHRFVTRFQRSENAAATDEGFISLRAAYNALGQFLYILGFEAEYLLLCLKRLLKRFGAAFLRVAAGAARRMLALLKTIFGILLYDFAQPWRRLHSGFGNIRKEIAQTAEIAGRAAAAKSGIAYFFSGVRTYAHLLLPIFAYALPIGAACVFVYTVNTMLGYNFALAVEADGEALGYVENQTVFEDAKALVRGRIRTTKEGDEWETNPVFTLAIADKQALSSAAFLADKLIATSSEEIQNATGIYVDGELLGVTTEGVLLQSTLNGLRAPYEQPDNPNLRVEFVKDVVLLPGIYFTSSLTDASAIVQKLTGEVEGQRIYAVQKGDSPSGIAQKNNIPLKDLYALNPKMTEKGYRMPIGDELLIAKSENFLQVKTIERVTRQVPIAHETIKTNSTELAWGRKQVVVAGADGLEERLVEITRIDNIPVSEETILVTPISAPVTQEEIIGVKGANGNVAGDASTGNLIWPVPGYKYVSRDFRNDRGLDIAANSGVPIIAADNGIVQFAGSGAGSAYWSYGNFVQLSHSTGISTLYAHMSSVAVRAGDYVTQGQIIGYIGRTGRATGNHLHFEVQVNGGRRVDPYGYVKQPR